MATSPFVADITGVSQGIGDLISQRINERIGKRALAGDNQSLAQLSSRDPRQAASIGDILSTRQQTTQSQQQKTNKAKADIARTISNARPDQVPAALNSVVSLIQGDPELQPLVADIQDDIARFAENPQSVISEYQTANVFFSAPQAFDKSVSQRAFEDNIAGFSPEDKDIARRIKAGLEPRAFTPAEEFGKREVAKIEGREGTATGQIGLERANLDVNAAKQLLEKGLREAENQLKGRDIDANNAVSNIDALLEKENFKRIFGKLNQSQLPGMLRSQDAIDALALRDQIVGLITLENRQKLKGQGTITNTEQLTLERAASVLSNPMISDVLAKQELERVRKIFSDVAAKNKQGSSPQGVDLQEPVSSEAAPGAVIEVDF